MSKHKIREDKTCQNCGRFVGEQFCSHCGQENTEVRHSFIYLLKHFASDLFHYDSSLWSTTKLLLFSPATLSKEYMAGKRKSYVDPIKLYIFISFIAFFIPNILPENPDNKQHLTVDMDFDIDLDHSGFTISSTERGTGRIANYPVYNNTQLDSIVKINKIPLTEYYTVKLALKANESKNPDKQNRINEFILHNLPKVLFIYMPLFAFWLWLFHNKKKFLYFDSGIFTLHYFSFLLLIITILNIIETALDWLNLHTSVSTIISSAILCYTIFYFFKAHLRFYEEKWLVAHTKATIILLIDIILIMITLALFAILALFIA
ncbi:MULTISPECIES: DUF3667 domain-containing protein [unclassified Dysgonomonas]|uniref:DUF3667 domain-containing protein n=1 Tax=unclassified Dysgonomonas TaxID=2630389 RepID=UPI0006834E08|nr:MULTISPECIES: DUF3667 domain-containing protein [unclassified Dysgonomonas]MBD8346443.1 DUF3667 domain-containing protein [Dysgonomonas sp. HGC4]MBF0574642.1 DUF3667 domain-containing protein [Dysgonomonas sp. GY617]